MKHLCEAPTHTCKSTNQNNPHEVPQNLAPLRGAEKEIEESSSAFALFMQEKELSEALP